MSLTAASGEGGVLEIKAKVKPATRGTLRKASFENQKARETVRSQTGTLEAIYKGHPGPS